ncbi:hypothetical protein [Paenibacillus shenyangensis]|uniref:hypothetical protein n=1 Tax=Paenibacillus sp. A9 TaxID=1284352 RepID=UPI00037E33B3|nr:hypothetical protein [Paenibacillus sp. A9]
MTPAYAQSPQKATWLWNTQLIVNSTASILSFAVSQNVTLIYLQVNDDLDANVYQHFIAAASAQGITVQALDGAPSWALDSRRHELQATLDWITTYQQGASADEKFSGIHIDIEPYLLPEWRTDQLTVIAGWQHSVESVVQAAHSLHIPASADIPFWLHTLLTADESATLSSWMMQQYDSITIMAYRDSASGILDVAEAQLAEGDAVGTPVYVGVETNPTSEGNTITFYEEGAAYLNNQLARVTKQAGKHDSFAGIAVHDYAGWSTLVSK